MVHPRCVHAADEFRLYSFKVDKLSGDVLPEPLDKANHVIDAIRYALQPMIKPGGATAFLSFLAADAAKQTAKPKDFSKVRGATTTELPSWRR